MRVVRKYACSDESGSRRRSLNRFAREYALDLRQELGVLVNSAQHILQMISEWTIRQRTGSLEIIASSSLTEKGKRSSR